MDSPAMSMWVGFIGGASHAACKLGGTGPCAGSTDKGSTALIPKGKTGETISKKARGRANVTVPKEATTAASTKAGNSADGRRSGGKRHVHWSRFTKEELRQQALCAPTDAEGLAECVKQISKQRNVTATRAYQRKIGWKQETLVWDLHEICGHDPRKDSIPDFMHLQMVVTKDKLYATAWLFEKAGISKFYSDKEFCSRLRACLPTEFTHGRLQLHCSALPVECTAPHCTPLSSLTPVHSPETSSLHSTSFSSTPIWPLSTPVLSAPLRSGHSPLQPFQLHSVSRYQSWDCEWSGGGWSAVGWNAVECNCGVNHTGPLRIKKLGHPSTSWWSVAARAGPTGAGLHNY